MRTALMVFIKEKGIIFYREDGESLIQFFGPLNTFVVACARIAARLEDRELEVELVTASKPYTKVRFTHVGGPITVVWAGDRSERGHREMKRR